MIFRTRFLFLVLLFVTTRASAVSSGTLFIEGGGAYQKVSAKLLNQSADLNPAGATNFSEVRKSELFQQLLGGVARIGLKLPTFIFPEDTWAGAYFKKPLNATVEFEGVDSLTGTLINKQTTLKQVSAGGFLRYYLGDGSGLKFFAEAYAGIGKIDYSQIIKGASTSTLIASAILLETGARLGTNFALSEDFYGQIGAGYHVQTSQPFVIDQVEGLAYTSTLKTGDRISVSQTGAKTDLRAILNGATVMVSLGVLF